MKLKDQFIFLISLTLSLIVLNLWKYHNISFFDQSHSLYLLIPVQMIVICSFYKKIYKTNKIKLFIELSILTLISWILFFVLKYYALDFSTEIYLGYRNSSNDDHLFKTLVGKDLLWFELQKPLISIVAIALHLKYLLPDTFCKNRHGVMKLDKSFEIIVEGKNLWEDLKSKIALNTFHSPTDIEEYLNPYSASDAYANLKLQKFSSAYFKCNQCSEYSFVINYYQKKPGKKTRWQFVDTIKIRH